MEEDIDEEAFAALLATGLIADGELLREKIAEGKEIGEMPGDVGQDDAGIVADSWILDSRVDEITAEIRLRAAENDVQPSLERVRHCLDIMGNPQEAFHSIHISGTNGKTSTARMCEALVRERGLRTGRFTSPELVSVRERISIDGHAISRQAFIDTWEDVAPFIEMADAKSLAEGGPRMSFFEVFAVMAFQAFAMAPVDVAVVEVGMGGTWDATNVIEPDVAVLTPVGVDHEKWLGSDIEDIAAEKLGIVKPGCVFVCAGQPEEVARMARERAAETGVRLIEYGDRLRLVGTELAYGGQMIEVRTPAARYESVPLALRGVHQGENAAVALAAVEAFFGGKALDGSVVEQAFMAVGSPGRMEVVRTSPTVVVDACHNPHGAVATAKALEECYPGRRVGVVAMMADKDMEGFLGVMEPVFDEVVVTGMPSERAATVQELAGIAREVFGEDRVHAREDLLEAVDLAAARAEIDDEAPMASPVVVVCGSIRLVGRARTLLGAYAPDGLADAG